MGGGILLGPGSELAMNDSTLERNEAQRGGGVVMVGEAEGLVLSNTSYLQNTAQKGPAIVLLWPSVRLGCTLHRLRLDDTGNDMTGHHIYWDFPTTGGAPTLTLECQDCTVIGDSNIFATNPVMSVVLQDGIGRVTHLTTTSGAVIEPPLTYVSLDVYNNTVTSTGSLETLDVPVTLALVRESDPVMDGEILRPYLVDGSYFSNLILSADVGSTQTLYFTPSEQSFFEASVNITINLCQPGEKYMNQSLLCAPCDKGSIKFDNTDAECIVCDDDVGLDCKGGSEFEVLPGYWLSSTAINTICHDDATGMVLDTQCVLEKVYKCDFTSACESDGNRIHTGDVFTLTTEDLCGEGYKADVALCGACNKGYQRNIKGECVSCPDNEQRVVRFVLIFALFSGSVGALWAVAVLLSRTDKLDVVKVRSAFRDENVWHLPHPTPSVPSLL
eukprot:gene4835-5904_t